MANILKNNRKRRKNIETTIEPSHALLTPVLLPDNSIQKNTASTMRDNPNNERITSDHQNYTNYGIEIIQKLQWAQIIKESNKTHSLTEKKAKKINIKMENELYIR